MIDKLHPEYVAPIQTCINEPGRRFIPLPGSHSLSTRGDAGVLEIGRFGPDDTREFHMPIAVSPEVAEILERMAEEIHADLALRFEAVTDSVYHLLDHPEDLAWVFGGVAQALDLNDDPTAAKASLADLKKGRRAHDGHVDPRTVRDLVSLLLRAMRKTDGEEVWKAQTLDFIRRKGLMPSPLREGAGT